MSTAPAPELPPLPLFGGLSPEELPELLTHATRFELGKGEPVFLQGEEADAFFVVLSGSVEIRVNSGDTVRVLAQGSAGAVLGETSLLLGGQHSASISTVEPTTLLRFSHQSFMDLLEQGNRGASRVLYNIARILAARLRSADDSLTELARGASDTAAVKGDLDRLRSIFFTEWA